MFVGISERTNEAGAAALSKAFGASLPVIPIPLVSHYDRLLSLSCIPGSDCSDLQKHPEGDLIKILHDSKSV